MEERSDIIGASVLAVDETTMQDPRADESKLREIFEKYASVEKGGEKFMTYEDFIVRYLNLYPHVDDASLRKSIKVLGGILDTSKDGVISFMEFSAFEAVLCQPDALYRTAFQVQINFIFLSSLLLLSFTLLLQLLLDFHSTFTPLSLLLTCLHIIFVILHPFDFHCINPVTVMLFLSQYHQVDCTFTLVNSYSIQMVPAQSLTMSSKKSSG